MTSVSSNKPFLKWVGGKTQLLPEIHSRLPTSFSVYYEPFVGGGAVYFSLANRAHTAHLSDINSDLINTYSVVKNSPDTLLTELSHHKNTEEYFYSIRNVDRSPEYAHWNTIEKAARFIYLNKTCFNGLYRVNSKGYFNTPYGKCANPKICDTETITECSLTLNSTNTTLRCGGYLDIVETISTEKDPSSVFVYLDPPYLPLTETSNFVSYSKDGFGEADHIQLADAYRKLTDMGVNCMMSNSSTPVVFDLYKNYTIHTVSARRNVASTNTGRRAVLEVLITNY
jgi:DNA adenine methylase